jgi:hypothetical protein
VDNEMSDDANPYQPPHTLEQPPAVPARRFVWKVYAFAAAAVQLVAMVLELPRLTPTDAVDYAITLIGTVGLFGFAYRRRVLGLPLWRVWSILFPLWDIFMGAWLYPRQNGGVIQSGYFVAMLLFLPEYFALLRYAYGSPELWHERPSRPD